MKRYIVIGTLLLASCRQRTLQEACEEAAKVGETYSCRSGDDSKIQNTGAGSILFNRLLPGGDKTHLCYLGEFANLQSRDYAVQEFKNLEVAFRNKYDIPDGHDAFVWKHSSAKGRLITGLCIPQEKQYIGRSGAGLLLDQLIKQVQ